jgi:hypothetical protein
MGRVGGERAASSGPGSCRASLGCGVWVVGCGEVVTLSHACGPLRLSTGRSSTDKRSRYDASTRDQARSYGLVMYMIYHA